MVERVRRTGPVRRPELADVVVMRHEGIEGTQRVQRRAFEKTWEPRGWELVTDEPPAEQDDQGVVGEASESPADAPPVAADPDTAPEGSTRRGKAKTDTSEES